MALEKTDTMKYLPLVGPIVSIISAVALGSLWVNSQVGKTDQTIIAVAELKHDFKEAMDRISSRLDAIPGDQVRIGQLERKVPERDQQIGGIDARLRIVEQKTESNTSSIAEIQTSSRQRLRP